MSTLHEQRQADPVRSHRPARKRWLLVVGVVTVVCVVSVTSALLFRAHPGNILDGSHTVQGSGVPASQARNLPPFTGVELAGSSNVTVRVGEAQTVVVQADDNLLGHVRTTVRSGALVIDTTGSFSTRTPLRVAVTVPELTTVRLTGSGNVVVDGVDSPSLVADLPGSGNMLVSGHTQRLEAGLQGSGQMSMHGLIAEAVHVQLSGSGEVQVYATGSLEADVSGSGSVTYAGDPPHVTSTVTGSGVVAPE